jgi:hypothetical protein
VSYRVIPSDEEAPLTQGDIIRGLYVVASATGIQEEQPQIVQENVIVLSQNCEIDKAIKNNQAVLVASIKQLSVLPSGDQGNVRKNRVLSLFYLPKEDPFPVEGYIDWRTIQPVLVSSLFAARIPGKYVCSLSEELLKSASERMWDFFFRPMPLNPALHAPIQPDQSEPT